MTSNQLHLEIQQASNQPDLCPSDEDFKRWCNLSLQPTTLKKLTTQNLEVTLRLVTAEESQELNFAYRGKDAPTNVLAFPYEDDDFLPAEAKQPILGDLVICVDQVQQEALEQNKPLANHFAHLTLHGMLHLQGYDHLTDAEAEQMEALEIQLLAQLGIANPY